MPLRRSFFSTPTFGLLLSALLVGLPARAQMHHVDAPERVTRAVGVYEWTGDLRSPSASRLVPVSLFIDGHFEDAASYRARPIPLALEPGNVYSIEKAGEPQGLFDLVSARQIATPAGADADASIEWLGTGRIERPAAAKKSALQPSATLSHVNSATAASAADADDARPHFTPPRPEAGEGKATPGAASGSASPAEDSERPTLGRRNSADATTDDSGKKPGREKPQSYVSGVVSGLNDDPDRPTMRRGKVESADTATLTGRPADLHQAVAVSDPAKPEPHVFAREWESAAERTQTLVAMDRLAEARVREYLRTNHLDPGAVAAGSSTAGTTAAASGEPPAGEGAPPSLKRTPHGISTSTAAAAAAPSHTTRPAARNSGKPASPAVLLLANQQLTGLELSYGGLPTFVYSADVAAHPPAARTAEVIVHVTLVAQRLPSGELQPALSSLTDSGHLNRDPWLRFVDAVDADGSHRASLLFEQRSARTRQFALYRVVTNSAEQTFTTAPLP